MPNELSPAKNKQLKTTSKISQFKGFLPTDVLPGMLTRMGKQRAADHSLGSVRGSEWRFLADFAVVRTWMDGIDHHIGHMVALEEGL